MEITLKNEKGTFSVSAEEFVSQYENFSRQNNPSYLRETLLDFLKGYGESDYYVRNFPRT